MSLLAEQKISAFFADILEEYGNGSGNAVYILGVDVAQTLHYVVELCILQTIEVTESPEVLDAHLKVSEEFHTCTEAYTVFETVLDVVPGLLRLCCACKSAFEAHFIGNRITYERLGETVNPDEITYSQAELELNRNLNETGLEVKLGVGDVGGIERRTLHVVEDGRLNGKDVAYANLISQAYVILVN